MSTHDRSEPAAPLNNEPTAVKPLRVGVAGLGAIGSVVVDALIAGIPGMTIGGVLTRRPGSMNAIRPLPGDLHASSPEELAARCDVVVECMPPDLFRQIAEPAIAAGRLFIPMSVAQLIFHDDLFRRAAERGSRIIIPSGAIAGLDGIRAASQAPIASVTIISTKPPAALSQDGDVVSDKRCIFSGSVREAAQVFPRNVNIAAAVSFAGIGPDRTRMEIWTDPTATRNSHRVEVDAEAARMTFEIEAQPSPGNARTSRLAALSAVAELRRLGSEHR